jgi:probable rRNA maturation factor
MNKISVFSTQRKFDADIKEVSAIARRVFLLLKKDGFSADFYLVNNIEMRKLNRVYRKKDKSTNVLTFCEPKNFVRIPNKFKYLGEIYICPEYIYSRKQDTNLMIAHGILHLFGYDHETRNDRVKMEGRERFLLLKLSSNI